VIKGIDTTAARKMPGVPRVYTGADLAAYGTLNASSPVQQPGRHAHEAAPTAGTGDRQVRFVGDPVAFVVADTLLQAKDAAEAVEVDIDALPAVVRPEEAARPGAPLIPRRSARQCRLDYHFGDSEQVAPPSPRPHTLPGSSSSTAAWS